MIRMDSNSADALKFYSFVFCLVQYGIKYITIIKLTQYPKLCFTVLVLQLQFHANIAKYANSKIFCLPNRKVVT